MTDMTMDAAVRRKCLSHVVGWVRRPLVSRTASLSCVILKDSTTDLLRLSWEALRILRHLLPSVRARLMISHKFDAQRPVVLKYHAHAATENFSSDDVARAVGVDSGS